MNEERPYQRFIFPQSPGHIGGLTLREYAAIQIMSGLASDSEMAYAKSEQCSEEAAMVAVDWAYALIEELNKKD